MIHFQISDHVAHQLESLPALTSWESGAIAVTSSRGPCRTSFNCSCCRSERS